MFLNRRYTHSVKIQKVQKNKKGRLLLTASAGWSAPFPEATINPLLWIITELSYTETVTYIHSPYINIQSHPPFLVTQMLNHCTQWCFFHLTIQYIMAFIPRQYIEFLIHFKTVFANEATDKGLISKIHK